MTQLLGVSWCLGAGEASGFKHDAGREDGKKVRKTGKRPFLTELFIDLSSGASESERPKSH
jgi:hypothetical protein